MKQARVLTETEFKRLLAVVAQTKHAGRNRLALMGADETLDVEEFVAASFESHRDRLPKAKDLKMVPIAKVSRTATTSVN